MRRTAFLCVVLFVLAGGLLAAQCKVTPGNVMDPGYNPVAPKRASVSTGLGATVEFWLAGPDGYTEKLRGTVVADKNGRYRFQCPFPSASTGRAPHIHMVFAADGFLPIETEIFPGKGSISSVFDVVLALGD